MDNLTSELKTLFKQRNYITRVIKDGDGCVIKFPHQKLTYQEPEFIEYIQFQREKEEGLNVYTSLNEENKDFIPLPEYAFRFFILCEIWALHINWNLPLDLVTFIDESNNHFDDIEHIIQSPLNTQKEQLLRTLCLEGYRENFPKEYEEIAVKHGIDSGYQAIVKFFKKEDVEL